MQFLQMKFHEEFSNLGNILLMINLFKFFAMLFHSILLCITLVDGVLHLI
ncbi:hypothetical protein JHK86_043071 [Glycine max]|nr:hypothetical protein JHK86_043071 [Glycine max]